MRNVRTLGICLCLLLQGSAICQTSAGGAPTPASALTILANAWKSFSNGAPVHRLQLSGQVSTYAGSSADGGLISATTSVDSSSASQMSLGRGTWAESKVAAGTTFQCSWAGPDNVRHAVPAHTCWQAVPWLSPSLSVQASLLASNVGVNYLGHEILGGVGVEHLRFQVIYGDAQTPSAVTSLIQQASTADLYLDSSTFLPVSLRYLMRADDNADIVIPVEVRYSGYAQLGGIAMPRHIERSVDGSLQEVVDISAVTAN